MAWWEYLNKGLDLETPESTAESDLSTPPAPISPTQNDAFLEALNAFRGQQAKNISGFLEQSIKPLQTPEEESKTNLGLLLTNFLGPRSSASDTYFTSKGPVYTGTPQDQIDRDQAVLREAVLAPKRSAAEKREMSLKAWDLMNQVDTNLANRESKRISNLLHGAQTEKALTDIGKTREEQAYKQALRSSDSPESFQLKSDALRDIDSMSKVAAENYGMNSALANELRGMSSRINNMTGEEAAKEWKRADDLYKRQTGDYAAKSSRMSIVGTGDNREYEREKELAESYVEGFVIKDPRRKRPTKRAAGEVQAAKGTLDSILGDVDVLESMVREKGVSFQDKFGAGADQSSVRQTVILRLKELHNLGVLNGSDLRLMETQVPDPTGLGALYGNQEFLRRMQVLKNGITKSFYHFSVNRNYDDDGFRSEYQRRYGVNFGKTGQSGGTGKSTQGKVATAAEVKAYADRYYNGDVNKARSTLKRMGVDAQ